MPLLSEAFARLSLHARGWRSRTAPAATGTVHWVEAPGAGTLPTTVLLHGFNSSGSYNAPLLQLLRPHVRRLVAPDLPAHGFSSAPADLDGHSIYEGTRDALDAALTEPSVLVGSSMGGAIAIRYAGERPANVRALVLVAPGGAPMSDAELTALRALFTVRTHAEASAFIDRLLVRRTPLRPLLAASLRRGFARPAIRALLDGLGHAHFLTPEELAAVRAPVLLLWGAEERVLPASGLDFFRENLPPGARVEIMPGVGHSPQIDDCQSLAARIVAFLRETSAVPSVAP